MDELDALLEMAPACIPDIIKVINTLTNADPDLFFTTSRKLLTSHQLTLGLWHSMPSAQSVLKSSFYVYKDEVSRGPNPEQFALMEVYYKFYRYKIPVPK